MPQNAAGQAILPPVLSASARCATSLPSACVTPAAPPEEPPQLRKGSSGFLGIVNPLPTFTENPPNPNSSCAVLPMMIAPSARNRATAVASNGGRYPLRINEPAVDST